MKILHVSFADDGGGAAIAAHRLLAAQRKIGIDAYMLVVRKQTDDPAVHAPLGEAAKLKIRMVRSAAKRIGRLGSVGAPHVMRSLGLVSSGIGEAVRRETADLIHLHWVGGEMMSLREMAALPAPVVWTCHDMWPFCGAEHYASGQRFMRGYESDGSLDIEVLTFRRKRRLWARWHPLLVCPSTWIAKQAEASLLMRDAPRAVIPNTLDMDIFRPLDRDQARNRLQLPREGRMVLFGADQGRADPRKGFDLLEAALARLPSDNAGKIFLATFGSRNAVATRVSGLRSHEFGVIRDDERLALLYSAADVFVAPSRQDNLPNTLLEAQACGLPCVAFDVGGMSDIIESPLHGALVKPFDVDAFAAQIMAAGEQADAWRRDAIRKDAVSRFGAASVARRHLELYDSVLAQAGDRSKNLKT